MVDAMEIEKGFKKTEVGVIPADWDVLSFGSLIDYVKGFAFKSSDYKKDGIRIIRVSDMNHACIKKEGGVYIDEIKADDYKNWKLEENDLVFTTVGSKPPMYDSLVGKVILIDKEISGSFLNQNSVIIRTKNKSSQTQKLLLNHFRTARYVRYIEIIHRGNANQASITLKELFKYKIPLPPTKSEQTAIATTLNNANALITQLEKLIAKKINIKQGTMQNLLKPKEGWDVKKLGQVAEINMGQSPDSKNYNLNGEGMPLIQGNADIKNRKSIKRVWTKQITKTCKQNDLIMTVRAPVGAIGIASENSCIGRGVCSFKSTDVDKNFLFHLLIFKETDWKILEQGSTFTSANSNQIFGFELSIPKDEPEQTRIVQILSDMDVEIEALGKKLEKYKMIKQGMMQELLTGKTRLI